MVHFSQDTLENWTYINMLWKSSASDSYGSSAFYTVLFTGDAIVLATSNNSLGSLFKDNPMEIKN